VSDLPKVTISAFFELETLGKSDTMRVFRRREHQGPHGSDQQVALLRRHVRPRHPVPRREIGLAGSQQTLDAGRPGSGRQQVCHSADRYAVHGDTQSRRRDLPNRQRSCGPHQGAGRAGRERPVASGLDIARTDGLSGDHRPRRVHHAGLRSRSRRECSRWYAPGRPGTGKASRGDRFSCHAVWRTDAAPDRLGVRKSDTSSDVAPRIWPVGREEMRGWPGQDAIHKGLAYSSY
jgi:hypothetical protein